MKKLIATLGLSVIAGFVVFDVINSNFINPPNAKGEALNEALQSNTEITPTSTPELGQPTEDGSELPNKIDIEPQHDNSPILD